MAFSTRAAPKAAIAAVEDVRALGRRDHRAVLQEPVVTPDRRRLQVSGAENLVGIGPELGREVGEALQGCTPDQRHVVQGQEDVVESQDLAGCAG